MLEAAPVGIFSWAFTVSSAGETVAEINPAWFSEQAGVTVAGIDDGRLAWARLYVEPVDSGGEGIDAAVRELSGRNS